MIAPRKTSAQPSRNSFALDDRASQNFATADQNNRNSVVYASSGEEEKTEANDNSIDHLKKFETSDFPPEPPLDASRTSLVITDEDLSENDRTQNGPESEVEGEDSVLVNEEKPPEENGRVITSKYFLLAFILGLIVLFIGVILEMKFNVLKMA